MNGNNGDLFVQKSPASTIQTLAEALMDFSPAQIVKSKLLELVMEKNYMKPFVQEEMLKAQDLGDFYRVPADNRNLNYNIYYDEGLDYSKITEYNSHNTKRLDKEEVKNLLLSVDNI